MSPGFTQRVFRAIQKCTETGPEFVTDVALNGIEYRNAGQAPGRCTGKLNGHIVPCAQVGSLSFRFRWIAFHGLCF